MAELLEIRWHGRGGQGAKTAAQILAETAMNTGAYIQAFPEYGPERAGAPMQAFTRISEVPINLHSGVHEPDIVVVLDPSLLNSVDVTAGLKEKGTLLVNTDREPSEIAEQCGCSKAMVATVNASHISTDTLGRSMPNLPMLGALLKLRESVGRGEDVTKKGWKEIPSAGLILEPGSAERYETGDWRTHRPVVDQDTCTNCLQCWVHCPDSAILVSDGEMIGFNYDHCKGCGICASICPVSAIAMEEE